QRVQTDRAQEVYANDGQLTLALPAGGLPGAESYLVVMPTGAVPGAPPAGMALVGEAYAVTASGAVATLERPAALTLSYDGALVSGPPPAGLALYRWDPVGVAWQPVAGQIDAAQRAVSATVTALGIYGLMAPAGPWSVPDHRVWLPATGR
ncbi:MAG: hypothetical protein HGA45_39080, partial [Chloroflexales bacterium]|nr:hypothetical protein [Chloroflexales bacterium]